MKILHKLLMGIAVGILLLALPYQLIAQCNFTLITGSTQCSPGKILVLDTDTTTIGKPNWTLTYPSGATSSILTNWVGAWPVTAPGTYTVRMDKVLGGTPCSKTITNIVTIQPVPTFNATFSSSSNCTNNCIKLVDASTPGAGCAPLRYVIDWKNSIDTLPNICHTYTSNGSYNPSVKLTNACGCKLDTTIPTPIVISTPPFSTFSGINLTSCATPYTATMTIANPQPSTVKYNWYVSPTGAGTYSLVSSTTATTFTHAYTTGIWDVKLVLVDTISGCTDSFTQTNYVNVGGVAATCLTQSAWSGCAPLQVQFTNCTADLSNVTSICIYAPGITGSPFCYNNPPYPAPPFSMGSVTYNTKGIYDILVVQQYVGGCVDSLKLPKSVRVGSIPAAANFTVSTAYSCTTPFVDSFKYTGPPLDPSIKCSWAVASSPSVPINLTPIIPGDTCFGMMMQVSSFSSYTPELFLTDTFGCLVAIVKPGATVVSQLVAATFLDPVYNNNTCVNHIDTIHNITNGGPFSLYSWTPSGPTSILFQDTSKIVLSYNAPGKYPYCLSVQNLQGCKDTVCDTIRIYAKPTATVFMSPDTLCVLKDTLSIHPTDTNFTYTIWPEGARPPLKPHIFLPKGVDTTAAWVYSFYGPYYPCYLAFNKGCPGDTICADTVLVKPGIAKMTKVINCASPNCVTHISTSMGVDSVWFTDYLGVIHARADSLDTLVICYPTAGVKYHIQICGLNKSTGCRNCVDDTVIIPCVITDFVADSLKGCNTLSQPFFTDSLRLIKPAGCAKPTGVVWDYAAPALPGKPNFGASTSTNDPQSINYSTAGYKNVCVQITNSNGCKDTICKYQYITVASPTPSFTVSTAAGCIPVNVNFTNTSTFTYSGVKSVLWSWNDASVPGTSTLYSDNHTYIKGGLFHPTLKVTDSIGCVNSISATIRSYDVHAGFSRTINGVPDSFSCTFGKGGQPLTFTNTSSSLIDSFKWTITPPDAVSPPPAGFSKVSGFTTKFSGTGLHTICQYAKDASGLCIDSICKTVNIVDPVAYYGISNIADTFLPCGGPISLLDSSTGFIVNWQWDLHTAGYPLSTKNLNTQLNNRGVYPVTLIVTSKYGCVDTLTRFNIHVESADIKVRLVKANGCPSFLDTFFIRSVAVDTLYLFTDNGVPIFKRVFITVPGTDTFPRFDTILGSYPHGGLWHPTVYGVKKCSPTIFSTATVDYTKDPTLFIAVDSLVPHFTDSFNCSTHQICMHSFSSDTMSSIYRWIWDFGDGTSVDSLSGTDVCHTYATFGNYNVILSVRDTFECQKSLTQSVHFPKPPVAKFGISDTIGCVPFPVVLTDSSVVDDSTTVKSYQWTYTDSATLLITTKDDNHTFIKGSTPTWTITHTVVDGYGCSSSATRTVTANPPPTLSAGNDTIICKGTCGQLNGSGSGQLAWQTNYAINDTAIANPIVCPLVDTFYILKVGSLAKCSLLDTVNVFVSTISGVATADTVCRGNVNHLSSSVLTTHATVATYDWSFGDATTGTGTPVTHTYAASGFYTATVIATNTVGCKDTLMAGAGVIDKPHARIVVPDTSVCLGDSITMCDSSTAGSSIGIRSFYWDFESNSVIDDSTNKCITYQYPAFGPYTITLQVVDSNGCSDQTTQVVNIHQLPTASYQNDTNCINIPNTFQSNTLHPDGNIVNYNWIVDTTHVFNHTYDSIIYAFPTLGNHTVTLTVTDANGCKDDTSNTFFIIDRPRSVISTLDTTICAGFSVPFKVSGTYDSLRWVPSAWVSNPTADSVLIKPKQTIEYLVYTYLKTCVPKVDTVNIWVIDSVPISVTANPTSIVLGLSSDVTSHIKGTVDSIVWSPYKPSALDCRTCDSVKATPDSTTTFTATIYYSHNGVTCMNASSVTITVIQSCDGSLLYIPDHFTPNSDGTNDLFRIIGRGIDKVNYFRIFDKWGNVVYQATDVSYDPTVAINGTHAAWNGCKGNDLNKPMNSDVYVYQFEVKCIVESSQPIRGKGTITLVR